LEEEVEVEVEVDLSSWLELAFAWVKSLVWSVLLVGMMEAEKALIEHPSSSPIGRNATYRSHSDRAVTNS
jgi:hypothetical protein